MQVLLRDMSRRSPLKYIISSVLDAPIGIGAHILRKDAVHKRCAARDAVGVRGGLASKSKLLKDLRKIRVCR